MTLSTQVGGDGEVGKISSEGLYQREDWGC